MAITMIFAVPNLNARNRTRQTNHMDPSIDQLTRQVRALHQQRDHLKKIKASLEQLRSFIHSTKSSEITMIERAADKAISSVQEITVSNSMSGTLMSSLQQNLSGANLNLDSATHAIIQTKLRDAMVSFAANVSSYRNNNASILSKLAAIPK